MILFEKNKSDDDSTNFEGKPNPDLITEFKITLDKYKLAGKQKEELI